MNHQDLHSLKRQSAEMNNTAAAMLGSGDFSHAFLLYKKAIGLLHEAALLMLEEQVQTVVLEDNGIRTRCAKQYDDDEQPYFCATQKLNYVACFETTVLLPANETEHIDLSLISSVIMYNLVVLLEMTQHTSILALPLLRGIFAMAAGGLMAYRTVSSLHPSFVVSLHVHLANIKFSCGFTINKERLSSYLDAAEWSIHELGGAAQVIQARLFYRIAGMFYDEGEFQHVNRASEQAIIVYARIAALG
jgi:hypothetical protein